MAHRKRDRSPPRHSLAPSCGFINAPGSAGHVLALVDNFLFGSWHSEESSRTSNDAAENDASDAEQSGELEEEEDTAEHVIAHAHAQPVASSHHTLGDSLHTTTFHDYTWDEKFLATLPLCKQSTLPLPHTSPPLTQLRSIGLAAN